MFSKLHGMIMGDCWSKRDSDTQILLFW